MPTKFVEVSQLKKSFAGHPAVTGLSMDVEAGQVLGLVGANGGGKTTTLRMLAGLLIPDGGRGTVLGQELAQGLTPVRHDIGYMSQRPCLHAELTVRENLRFYGSMLDQSTAAQRIEEDTVKYGIVEIMEQRVGRLSGGWMRRVQFVATNLRRPKLLLLDEPTAGLDIVSRRDFWRWLKERAGNGSGIIISTHDLAEAEGCDWIIPYHCGIAFAQQTPASFVRANSAANMDDAMLQFVADRV